MGSTVYSAALQVQRWIILQRDFLQEQQTFHKAVRAREQSSKAANADEQRFQYLDNKLEKTITCYRDLIEVGNFK